MDLRVCDKCERFRCGLVQTTVFVSKGFYSTQVFIVVECGDTAVAVEPVGTPKVVRNALRFMERTADRITVDMLSDDLKEEYDMAIDRVVEKLKNASDYEECDYRAEQLMSQWNNDD